MKDIDKIDNEMDNAELPDDTELPDDAEEDEDDEVQILTLVDDEGNESDFELLDVVEYKGGRYAVLCTVEEDEDAGGEAAILKIVDNPDSEDDEDLVTPETDEEITAVYEIFKEMYKDIIDFED